MNVQRKHHTTYLRLLLLLLLPALCTAQSPEDLLTKGGQYYESDQLDSAKIFYQQAYQSPSQDIQLQAIGGLVKVAILQADMATADSLIQIGNVLLEKNEVDLSTLGKYKTIKGEYLRKNARLEEALKQHKEVIHLSKKLNDEPLIHAYALFYTALAFEQLTEYDSSLVYADSAYRLFKQHLDTTDLKFSGIYNGLAVCYQRANQLEQAKQFYLKSKAIAEDKLGPVSSDLAICLNNLSSISRAEENYREAIAYSEQALKISRALKDEQGISSAYYALGVYHYFLGDYGRTKDYMEACIAIRERLFSPTHYSLIGPYEVLGIAHEEAGDYQKALFYLRKALEKIQANYSQGSLQEGFNYENTALTFKSLGQLDSALHYIQKAHPILSRQLPENDYSLGVHYFSHANILYQLGNLAQADKWLLQSNRVYEALGMESSSEYAQNIALQGLILAEKQSWKLADQKFETALDKIRSADEENADTPSFQMTPNSLWLLNEYMDYLFTKYQATGSKAALNHFETYSGLYLNMSNKFRKQFVDSYTKSVLIKDNAEVYDRNIGIYHQLYQKTKQEDYLKAAYHFSEYGRTALLRDMLDEKVLAYAGLPDSVLQKERSLKKQISNLNQQLLENPADGAVKEALFQNKEALNKHIEHTLHSYPRYYDLKFSTNVPDLPEIQAQLKPSENLVEYMRDDTAYYALLLNPAKKELVYLGKREQINEAVKNWKEAIVTQDKAAYATAGQALYQKLWQPLETQLGGERVTIVPIGPLFYLNFETLPKGKSYLIHQYNITYALSFTVLFSEMPVAATGSLFAVAPGFEDDIKRQYEVSLDTLETIDENYLHTVRQPWSLKLVRNVSEQFVNEVYMGLKATESNIKANIHKGRILYFGTHAIADPSDPLRSRLVLAKEVGEQQEDGYLHAYELYGLPLNAELAVLNACESGLGNLQKGEGMISLAYSLHFAGCPSTIMSLWKVDEKTNTQISSDCLNYLQQGVSKSEALRQAKLDYLNTADAALQHPFYWGGMVLMGKDGVVELQKKSKKWYVFLGIGVIAIFLFYRRVVY